MPRLPVLRLPPGGSLGTPKILSTGATLHVGPIRLHVEKLGVPCVKIVSTVPKIWRAVPIFLARVNGVLVTSIQRGNYIVCLSVESTLNEENDRSL